MKIDEATIGAALKAARQKAGLTQSDVAKKFSVSPQAVGYWEVGKTSPSLVNLARLSRLYKAPTDALLGLDKESLVGSNSTARQGYDIGEIVEVEFKNGVEECL